MEGGTRIFIAGGTLEAPTAWPVYPEVAPEPLQGSAALEAITASDVGCTRHAMQVYGRPPNKGVGLGPQVISCWSIYVNGERIAGISHKDMASGPDYDALARSLPQLLGMTVLTIVVVELSRQERRPAGRAAP